MLSVATTLSIQMTVPNNYIYNRKTIFLYDHDLNDFTEFVSNNDKYHDFNINRESAELYTKTYNQYHAYSFVITIDRLTHLIKHYPAIYYIIHELIKTKIEDSINLGIDHILCIFEQGEIRGYHANIIIFMYQPLNKDALDEIKDLWYSSIEIDVKNFDLENILKAWKSTNLSKSIRFIQTYQKIKSVASYIHYMTKDPHTIIASDLVTLKMFLSFDRTFIFPESSIPKKRKTTDNNTSIFSNNDVTCFFLNLLNKGVFDYQESMKYPQIQNYLHLSNLHTIWENCRVNFLSNLTHEKNIIKIINDFMNLPYKNKCACPVFEWLNYQNIDIDTFMSNVATWLMCKSKKNCLQFIGSADAGKSHFAEKIWKLFYFHQRIIQDGLFSFRNCVNAGCCLWDEPFISQDIAETAKLILEGKPNVFVAIKGKDSQCLNKRIPFIITTNHEIYRYCSSARDAFDVRCYKYKCNNPFPNEFCTSSNHYCHKLDENSDTAQTLGSAASSFDCPTKGGTSQTCTKFHVLKDHHMLSFIAYVLYQFKENFDIHFPLHFNVQDLCAVSTDYNNLIDDVC